MGKFVANMVGVEFLDSAEDSRLIRTHGNCRIDCFVVCLVDESRRVAEEQLTRISSAAFAGHPSARPAEKFRPLDPPIVIPLKDRLFVVRSAG